MDRDVKGDDTITTPEDAINSEEEKIKKMLENAGLLRPQIDPELVGDYLTMPVMQVEWDFRAELFVLTVRFDDRDYGTSAEILYFPATGKYKLVASRQFVCTHYGTDCVEITPTPELKKKVEEVVFQLLMTQYCFIQPKKVDELDDVERERFGKFWKRVREPQISPINLQKLLAMPILEIEKVEGREKYLLLLFENQYCDISDEKVFDGIYYDEQREEEFHGGRDEEERLPTFRAEIYYTPGDGKYVLQTFAKYRQVKFLTSTKEFEPPRWLEVEIKDLIYQLEHYWKTPDKDWTQTGIVIIRSRESSVVEMILEQVEADGRLSPLPSREMLGRYFREASFGTSNWSQEVHHGHDDWHVRLGSRCQHQFYGGESVIKNEITWDAITGKFYFLATHWYRHPVKPDFLFAVKDYFTKWLFAEEKVEIVPPKAFIDHARYVIAQRGGEKLPDYPPRKPRKYLTRARAARTTRQAKLSFPARDEKTPWFMIPLKCDGGCDGARCIDCKHNPACRRKRKFDRFRKDAK